MSLTRKHTRLSKYDYSQSNYYFITTCAENRKEWFSEIKNNTMILNLYGEICETCLNALPQHYNNLEIDTFIIMPNHIHGIFIINNSIRDNYKLREGYKPSPTYFNYSLAEIIRGFKTFSSKQINKTIPSDNKFKWQRSFHDHIIRNDKSLNNIREYIITNPATWDKDVENPNNFNNIKLNENCITSS